MKKQLEELIEKWEGKLQLIEMDLKDLEKIDPKNKVFYHQKYMLISVLKDLKKIVENEKP